MKSDYDQAIDYLYGVRLFGTKLGLENTFKLAALTGNPQEKLRFIHVAGTNGKGSTCAMLESIYRAAGLRVGLFTSPHLVSFRERFQVNREFISEDDAVRLVKDLRSLMPKFSEENHPTFFEIVTVMALAYFAEQNCDLVIWETGLGGRLDATNIVTPLASVITNIQFDHQQWLGESLEKIAREKAGIIKRGIPVVTATEDAQALEVIRAAAEHQEAPLTVVTGADVNKSPLDSIHMALAGEHQRVNAAVAAATVAAIDHVIPTADTAIRTGLSRVHWPGRLQTLKVAGGRTILLDAAHNPAGAEALRAVLAKDVSYSQGTLIFGAMKDKSWAEMCRILAPLFRRILLAPIRSERSVPPEELAKVMRSIDSSAEIVCCASLNEALSRLDADSTTVITGSLYFVGEAIEALESSGEEGLRDERGLNDWKMCASPP